ncbi:hypothetical protein A6F49_12540 [Enteractinococcus helveticum]|uniref:Uncharacterized protein n=1 Tax=Enteractinococcus helveticum TaxID=1837282 RepID=A0A1B7LY36_9MICC|nr:hypothetical protein A6F49_12540 [Enteractinococcus helveticum]
MTISIMTEATIAVVVCFGLACDGSAEGLVEVVVRLIWLVYPRMVFYDSRQVLLDDAKVGREEMTQPGTRVASPARSLGE